jgi:drug/metabolite transporter (DMT)-like permease
MSGSKNCDTNRPVIALRFLILAGICFSLGFLTTNLAFGAASPAFVETIKAAEPITSAILAVTYGIEKLTGLEISSLGGIVTGVLISTLASSSSTSSSIPSSSASLLAAIIVMTSNLCFSLRGLYQKMHQRSIAASTKKSESSVPSTNGTGDPATATVVIPSQLDDLNLQFRMQQTGVAMLLIPTLFFDGPRLFYHSWQMTMHLDAKSFRAVIFRYILLSTANGLAFSSYK